MSNESMLPNASLYDSKSAQHPHQNKLMQHHKLRRIREKRMEERRDDHREGGKEGRLREPSLKLNLNQPKSKSFFYLLGFILLLQCSLFG